MPNKKSPESQNLTRREFVQRMAGAALVVSVLGGARHSQAQKKALVAPGDKPRAIFAPKVQGASVRSWKFAPDGRLLVNWDVWKGKANRPERYGQSVVDSRTGRIYRSIGLNERQWELGEGWEAISRDGWRVALFSSKYLKGDRVYNEDSEAEEGYSTSWLRLISPTGRVTTLKKLPQILYLRDLRFSPDGREILALNDNRLIRYNVHTRQARYVVRLPGKPLTPEGYYPKDGRQTWVDGDRDQGGSALSPDGRYILGWHSNISAGVYWDRQPPWEGAKISQRGLYSDFIVFDANTGKIVRRFPAPRLPERGHMDQRSFHARFSADGRYVLVEGPHWKNVLCLRFHDGKTVKVFDWREQPYREIYRLYPPVLSADGLHFCDEDGDDIVLKSALTGKVVRRAKNAIAKVRYDPDSRLPQPLAIAPDLSALFFRPRDENIVESRLWRWPLEIEPSVPPRPTATVKP